MAITAPRARIVLLALLGLFGWQLHTSAVTAAEKMEPAKTGSEPSSQVNRAFAAAEKSREAYISKMDEPHIINHSPQYLIFIADSMKEAKMANWAGVLRSSNEVLSKHPDLPDVIILKALAEKQLGQTKASQDDLRKLSELQNERQLGHTRATDATRDNEPDELWGMLKDSKKLDQIRKYRADEYEDLYRTYSQAVNTFK